jgi:hypothetical protein
MPRRPAHPTPYADVNAVLDALLAGARGVLGDHFAGLYLYGSLASGDFDPERSDIDFVVVTAGELPGELLPALEAMHAGLASGDGRKWAAKLEGSYVPRRALRRYDPEDAPRPQLNEGRFYVARHCSDWVIQRHVLREHGVALSGPPPSTLIDPVTPDDLRGAVRGILREWWEPLLLDHERLSMDVYRAYAVLTMCRALYTLRHGAIASKPVSARWARAELGARWAGLIERASAWRDGAPSGDMSGAADFVRFTLGRAGSFES